MHNLIRAMLKADKYGNEEVLENKNTELVRILWNNYKETGFLSARILDYLYDYNLKLVDISRVMQLISSMPDKAFEMVTVHDCFRALPAYGNEVRKQYNIILADLAEANLMQSMGCMLLDDPTLRYHKKGVIPREVILNANYTLA
jgi:hypothetical protein